ncbi:MAG: YkgJ family cysteine cluster protein [Firmicutes bacterium]|nr:YkgJ family cysteine cluster protein [Bacillota bacterium]
MSEQNEISFIVPEDIRYSCILCGNCCRHWSISVERKIFEHLSDSSLWEKLKARYPDSSIINIKPGDNSGQMEKDSGNCIMLDGNYCMIHSEMGVSSKPSVCRMFPFICKASPDGIYVSASFHCPAVRQGKGAPLAESVPELINTLVDAEEEFAYDESVKLAPNLSTDWEGYLIIENYITDCIENGDFMDGLWESIKTIASLVYMQQSAGLQYADASAIAGFLENPPPPPFEMDGQIASHQVQFATSMISVLELWKRSFEPGYSDIIMNGGTFLSDTFEKTIKTQPFPLYLKENGDIWDSPEFIRYIRHILIWRKYLISDDNLFSALTGLTFFPLIYVWYASVSAEQNGCKKPEKNELVETLGIMDLYLFHLGLFKSIFKKFSEGIMWFAGIKMESV